jgi:hypothetical protein
MTQEATMVTAPSPPHAIEPALTRRPPASPRRHLAWLAVGVTVSFALPYVLADRLGLPRDLYYGLYGAGVLALCAGWMLDTGQSLRELVSRRVTLAIGLGILAAAVSVAIVLATEDASSGPGGIELAGAVVWRGLFYGAVDGLLLTAFPIIVVFAALSESRLRRRKRGFAAVAAIALTASLLFTATYHLGYSDFRSAKIRKPVAGDLIWAAPVIATANPIGAPIAHAGLHVAAVTHSYDTDLFLPPH